MRGGALLLGAFLGLFARAAEEQAAGARCMTGVTLLDGAGGPPVEGTIVFRDGKIEAVGAGVPVPAGANVSSEQGRFLIPGLIACDSFLSAGPGDDDPSIAPEKVAFDGFDYFRDYRLQLAAGTTTAYLSPGENRLVPGQGSVARLGAPPDRALVERSAALNAVLTAGALAPPGLYNPEIYPLPSRPFPVVEEQLPHTRSSQVAELRRFLGAGGPIVDRLRAKELPLRVRADDAREIRAALALARDFGVRVVIVGGREAGELASEIKECGAAVVWRCPFSAETIDERDPSAGAGGGHTLVAFDAPRKLAAAGVPVAICGGGGDATELLAAASFAVAHGFPRDKALAAITCDAAALLGIESRAGSIRAGGDADFVLLSGAPFAADNPIVLKTFVGGEVVYEHAASKQEETRGDVVLRKALVLTGDGGRFPETDILIHEGKIVAVAANLAVRPQAQAIDCAGKVVIPGMIDLASRLGTHLAEAGAEEAPAFRGNETFLTSVGELLRPDDPAFRACAAEGVLGLVVRGGGGQIVSGTGAFVVPGAKPKDFVVRPFACIDIDVSGSNRLGRLEELGGILGRLKAYEAGRKAFEETLNEYRHRKPRDRENVLKEPEPPGNDPLFERLGDARKREIPLFVRARRGDEIEAVLRLLAEAGGYECALVEADGIARVENAARLTRGVILTPPYRRMVEGAYVDLPQVLADRDIPFALASGGAAGSLYLRQYAAGAVRRGLAPDRALRAITSAPARLLGLSDRFGTLAAGREATLVILDGEVFAPGSRVEAVLVAGNIVYRRS